jgi:hypothetical protein
MEEMVLDDADMQGWCVNAKADYEASLRAVSDNIGHSGGSRRSPRKLTKPKRSLMSNAASSAGGQDDGDEEEEDPVIRELKLWSNMDRSELMKFVRDDGVLGEFAFMRSKKKEAPIHYMFFQSHAAHLRHKANTESLFSQAGTHMYMYTNAHTHTDTYPLPV